MLLHSNIVYWLAANAIPGLSPHILLQALQTVGTLKTLFQLNPSDLQALHFSAKQAVLLKQTNWDAVQNELAWHNNQDQHLICYEDAAYPDLLKEIMDPPPVLYVRGYLAALKRPQIAVVGSRKATMTGVSHAQQFAHALSERGLVVTSGLALGIDAAAHRGALQAAGVTIGVVGSGHWHPYPKVNIKLMEQILAANGAIVSEFSLATKPFAANFPRRNRIISGLSFGVLVVEAAVKSGSLITARLSAEAGREVFAIPGAIGKDLSKGCHQLIQQGAKLVQSVEDIVNELSALNTLLIGYNKYSINKEDNYLSKEEQEVLKSIEDVVTPMDMILCQTQLTACKVSSILLSLELEGYIEAVSGGYRRVA